MIHILPNIDDSSSSFSAYSTITVAYTAIVYQRHDSIGNPATRIIIMFISDTNPKASRQVSFVELDILSLPVSSNAKEILFNMKISINAIAKKAGLHRNTVRDAIYSPNRRTSYYTLKKTAHAISELYFNVTVDELAVGVGVSSNPHLRSLDMARRARQSGQFLINLCDAASSLLS